MPQGEPGDVAGERDVDAELLAFLIADIRGYTSFTNQHGDEAAGRLTARFAAIVRGVVPESGGTLFELRGDEAMCVFNSPRRCIRAALTLQQRFVEATLAHPELRMTVGIGIDVGEAVRSEDGYRGGALNMAARLCARAAAGEVLATSELTHLAGRLEGVRYAELGPVSLKGMSKPVRPVRVSPEGEDPAAVLAGLVAAASSEPVPISRWTRRRVTAAAGAAVLGAGLVTFLAWPGTGSPEVHDGSHHGSQGPGSHPAKQVGGDEAAALGGDGTVGRTVPVGHSPTGLAVGAGAVWVVNTADSSVTRIDLASSEVDPVPLDPSGKSPVAAAVLGNRVWVANADSANVSEINTATKRVVDTVSVGHHPSAIAAGFEKLWVTNAGDATVTVIDPTHSPARARTVDVGTSPDGIAVGGDAVWVANRDDNTVSRLDPDTFTLGSPIPVGAGPAGITVAAGAVWVADSLALSVTRIDVSTLTTTTTQVGDTPLGITAFAGAVWVATAGDGRVARLHPTTGRVTHSYKIGGSPQALAAVGSTLWLTSQAFASTAHVGGTLTYADTAADLKVIDPAIGYGRLTFSWSAVYDTLVTVNHAGGPAGFELVPDLAKTLPTPVDGGREYTFTLRQGIRYSDGSTLRAADFRRGIERAIPLLVKDGDPAGYFAGIVGAATCLAHPSQPCSLSRGIRTNDHADTVTFRLTEPDPDFLAKLSTSELAAPAPPGTPRTQVATPIPGTGPYEITTFEPGKRIVLTRNPHFHVWSTAAQPAGYPDEIDIVGEPSNTAAVHAVELGQADLADASRMDGADLRDLRKAYPGRVWTGPLTSTQFVALNAQVPPFNNPLARRAVAYALNRDRQFSAALDGRPSCTVVPPGWPGQYGSCAGRPDLHQARRLVQESGTAGDRVRVDVLPGPPFPRLFRHVTKVLNSIGYHATLTVDRAFDGTSYDPRRPVNAEWWNWGTDFPALSQFYQPLVSCTEGLLRRVVGCKPAFDRLARRALEAQTSDPATAQRLWQSFYTGLNADARLIATCTLPSGGIFVSKNVGHVLFSTFAYGPFIDQLWVR